MEQLKRWYEDRMDMESSVLDSINEANRDSGVSPTPDNGFVNYRKVTEVEKVKIMYILQDAAHGYIAGSESRRSPGDVVSHLLKSGAPVEALCVVMELRPEEVYNLADNRMHSYVLNSYKRVFENLEEHMATRKYTRVGNLTGEDIERMDLDAQGQDCMRELYNCSPRDFETSLDVVKYLVSKGMKYESMAHILHTSSNAVRLMVEQGGKMTANYRSILNQVLKTDYRE